MRSWCLTTLRKHSHVEFYTGVCVRRSRCCGGVALGLSAGQSLRRVVRYSCSSHYVRGFLAARSCNPLEFVSPSSRLESTASSPIPRCRVSFSLPHDPPECMHALRESLRGPITHCLILCRPHSATVSLWRIPQWLPSTRIHAYHLATVLRLGSSREAGGFYPDAPNRALSPSATSLPLQHRIA